MFNERSKERSKKTKQDIPVKHLPKYKESKKKGEELVKEHKYNLEEADFWILMNEAKDSSAMYYSGLIISHNGCLKINDALPPEKQFKPSCVSIDKGGFNGSLVYTYSCDEQGIYEVGEVSPDNCKNPYPYAMAFKRCFDRVVLKASKIAFSGIYSDSESDEFKEDYSRNEQPKEEPFETPKATTVQIKIINGLDAERVSKALKYYKVAKVEDLTVETASKIIKKIQGE